MQKYTATKLTMRSIFLIALTLWPLLATAQLVVKINPPKVIGQKTIVQLALTNNLATSIESARAICFLLDEQGKMVGQSSKWVVGGTKSQQALQPKSGMTFNFIITSPQFLTATNLNAQVSFTRIVLDGGQQADIKRDVVVTTAN